MLRILLIGFVVFTPFGFAQGPVPPTAPRKPLTVSLHGASTTDDYAWLKDKKDPETIKYLEAENAYTALVTAPLKPFEKALYDEMLSHVKQTDVDVPTLNNGYWYYHRTVEGQQYPIHCRRKGNMTAAEEIILDVNELAKGQKFMNLTALKVSDDTTKLMFSADVTGFREYFLNVKDLSTGKMIEANTIKVADTDWASDNRTILYVTEDAAKRSHKLWRHTLGEAKEKDTLLYEEKDELYRVGLSRTRDRKYFLRGVASSTTSEFAFAPCDAPAGPWTVIAPRVEGHLYNVDEGNGLFHINTNRDGATNFKWMTSTVAEPGKWTEYMPYNPKVFLEGIAVFKHYAVASERENGLTYLRVVLCPSRKQDRIAVTEPVYEMALGDNPEFDTNTLRYGYTSLVTPASVFECDMSSMQTKLLKQTEVPGYDPKQYTSERIEATAADGVKVPISIVYKKGFEKNGQAAAMLYAYGSYGFSMPVGFQASRLPMLDRGVVYAQAHIRGGSDLGYQWYLDGKLGKKMNTFTDFIACADHLVNAKYCARARLAIEGASAGGLLMGAVTNLRPDLCRVVHLGVPFVDVINTMLDETLPLTVQEFLEWGNPKVKADFDTMKQYCPYSNLKKCDYPAMLITTSLNDSQVLYHEPAKYIAKIRQLKTDKNLEVLRCNMDAGHGGASGRYDHLKERAFELAFLLNEVGIAK